MKILNQHGFSQAWVLAAERYLNEYQRVGDISVTALNDSPRIQELRRRHDDQITVDISDLMWLLLGQVMHKILEESADPNAIAEQRILVPFDGWQISMKADHIDPIPSKPGKYKICDYKITQTWAWRHGVSKSQEAQNNLYAFGYGTKGIDCPEGELEMFIKDFSAFEQKMKPRDYPAREVVRVPVQRWDIPKTEAYLRERIAIHKHARTCSDSDLPICTMDERWGSPDRFAVKCVTNEKISDRACPGGANFVSRTEAEAFVAKKGTGKQYVIEFRPGENKRCDRDACWVRRWCSTYNTIINPAF
jgi:hypothetical protein